jgi:DNA repair exonuclease SbcCD ATPase subunit
MQLKKLELKNFKRLVDFQARFRSGINVVKGPLNEMGKSTLLDSIIVALFNNPKSTAKELKDYVSWGSAKQYQTSLEFEDKGNTYLLEKDFDKGTIRLIDKTTGEGLDTFKEISEKISELLGTSSDNLFLCSSCIRQDQVSEISSGKKEISESLEEIVSGGKESTLASQVIQKLDDKISEIRKGLDRPAKIDGSLKSLKKQLENSSRDYTGIENEVSGVEARKIELVEVDKKLAQVKVQYENAKVLLEKNNQRKKVESSIEDLKHKYDEMGELLGGINKLIMKLEETNEAITSIDGLENELQVYEFRKGLDAIQNRRGDIEDDLAMREMELAKAKEKFKRVKFVSFFSSGQGIATAIVILVGGIIGVLLGPLYLLGLIILGAALLTIAALNRDKTSISGVEERIKQMKEALFKLDKEEEKLLAQVKCSTIADFSKKENDFGSRLKEKNSLEAQLKGMLRGRTVEDLQKREREIARGLAVEEEKLTDDLKETRLSPEEYVELEGKVHSLEIEQAELEKQKRRCEIMIEQARFNIEDQIRLEEELESLQEALKHEERMLKVYILTREFVSKARTEILSSTEEALEIEIQRYLTVFTNNKYKQVRRVNKEALDFWIYSDEKEDWAKPEDLSGGVIDEFYLAFRLALAGLVFGDKKPPLILDDPFVNFDSVRMANTLDFFKKLASDYQIIIFTLGDLYDKVADNIILLGEKDKPL